jgi:hypothetical protein
VQASDAATNHEEPSANAVSHIVSIIDGSPPCTSGAGGNSVRNELPMTGKESA